MNPHSCRYWSEAARSLAVVLVRLRFVLAAAAIFLFLPAGAPAQDAAAFFKQNCSSCHTIGGGRLAGPDLKNVHTRRDRAWLKQYIPNPRAMMDRGDPYALKLLQSAQGVIMPPPQGLTDARLDEILNFIEAESKSGRVWGGGGISDRPYTAADLVTGRGLFTGTTPLSKGGPACISCHTVGTLGGLGGGRLAPFPQYDLTRVYERLGGRKAVGAWLSAPATPTMQALFKNRPIQTDEAFAILATIEDAAANSGEADAVPLLDFFLMGLGGAVLGLVTFGTAWRTRFRSVRGSMVRGELQRGEE
ncbi:MAG: cytochrome c [Acidobacteria bacterium]|nr:cytochrome c [Acidobacteriota bacterium]